MADIYVSAGWGPRKESITQCAERLGRFLKALAKQDPLFARWQRGRGLRKKKAHDWNFAKKEDLVKMLEESKHSDSSADLGIVVGLENRQEGGLASDLIITCGQYCTNPHLGNGVVLDLPEAFPGMTNAKKMVPILLTMVKEWNAEDGGVISESSRNKRDLSTEWPYVDWIFY